VRKKKTAVAEEKAAMGMGKRGRHPKRKNSRNTTNKGIGIKRKTKKKKSYW